jgi:TM2 domain-containing membrane protein YozV
MQQVNSGTAYLLWCLCFFGIFGGQRFYTGNIGSGLIYLFTMGFFGIGQLIDLAIIPSMVDKRNIYLRGLLMTQQVSLNMGNILEVKQPSTTSKISPMQKLLKAAKEYGGQLSVAQAAIHTELETEPLKALLQEAIKAGYADIDNDPITGAIRYRFDV